MFWTAKPKTAPAADGERLSSRAIRRVAAEVEQLPPEQAGNQAVQVAAEWAQKLPSDWEQALVERLDARRALDQSAQAPQIEGHEIVDQTDFTLVVDRPGLVLRGCSNFRIKGGRSGPDMARGSLRSLTLVDCHRFEVDDLTMIGGRNGLVLHRCREFVLQRLHLEDFHGYALVVFACAEFDISDVSGFRNLAATVLCLGATHSGRFRRVLAAGGRGFFNCDAGLHINHCSASVDLEAVPSGIHEPLSILEKLEKPRMLVFEDVTTHDNRAQGVYVEGAVACVFRRLRSYSNNKEGICLDWGSVLCVLDGGWIAQNGERRGITPAEIEADFIQQFGILEDGSSAMKLPGVSLDNGALNIVSGTALTHNYGGGVKLVRASPCCAVWNCELNRNGLGENPGYVFLDLHSADLSDVNNEFVGTERLLDFGPSARLDMSGNHVG